MAEQAFLYLNSEVAVSVNVERHLFRELSPVWFYIPSR